MSGYSTKIIFIKMLRCIGNFFDQSSIAKVCNLYAKFNDSLNDAVAKLDQRILTIDTCSTHEHFDKCGN